MHKRKRNTNEQYYEGGRNRAGQEHGRGTLIEDGTVFRGRFVDGVRHGKGSLELLDDRSILSGVWHDGTLEGSVTLRYADGTVLQCTYVDGELDDVAMIRELDAQGRVTFEGVLVDDETKIGTQYDYRACSRTVGRHVNDELSDDDGIYFYPDGSSLRGKFLDGLAVNTRFFAPSSSSSTTTTTTASSSTVYKSDVSTSTTHIGDTPLRRDPYESATVFVAASSERGGGEGLFARHALPAHTVVAYYSGVRLTHKAEKARDWRLNSNSISLNDTHVIDVPAPFDSTDRYCASLGHKGIK